MMLILGTAQFGSNYGIKQDGQPSPPEIERILKTARRAGIDKVDTAPAYHCHADFTGFKVITQTPRRVRLPAEVLEYIRTGI